ncbi:MAG: amidohydrolase [Planctomycetes bacterium]|nr:amidohydrolase [Planctomycetota bacterium]
MPTPDAWPRAESMLPLATIVPWAAAAFALLAASGCACVLDRLAGASSRDASKMESELSPAARALVARVYADVDPSRLLDYHVHVVGLGEGGSGCYVNPHMRTWAHPVDRVKFLAYRSAGRIRNEEHAESEFLARLVELARGHRGRFLVLAFDENRDGAGRVVPEKTEFHVPSTYALRVAAEHPDLLVAAVSVHPLRPDALDELDRCAAAGARIVKWLPNAMGIDPSDPRCLPFYERMRKHGMILLSHGGEEAAVDAAEDQKLGNPLLLRAALDVGVKVICAHFAGLGDDDDLDDPARPRVASWRLLLRMMEDPRWTDLLFADISAATQANRTPEPLGTLLRREDLHARLVNGSDYPLPAVNVVISTRKLARKGFLTDAERDALNEIYDFNPIVFDYALKRCLVARDADGTEHRFAASVFEEHTALRAR